LKKTMAQKSRLSAKREEKPHSNGLEGKKAPDFTLSDQGGTSVTLNRLTGGRHLVLYFYPRDMTPGCTAEACAFRDSLPDIESLGARVVGISADSAESHQKFVSRNALNFLLLSDPGNRVAKLYGVYKKKSLYGRQFMGVERTTFIIDREGKVRKVFPKVRVAGHAAEVADFLKELQ
jgi:thioredoxin-dependent peroxiredoxin